MAAELAVWGPWVVAALVVLVTAWFVKWRLGDTAKFLRRGIRDALQDHLARYGDPFTISLMGKKHTVVNSPEAIKFVLASGGSAFRPDYSKQFKELGGEGKFMELPEHPRFRRSLLAAVAGDGLTHLLPFISSLAEKMVTSWENSAVVITYEEMRKYTFTVMMHFTWRDVEADFEEMEEILKDLIAVMAGLAALPINFPGFAYYKALKARRALLSRILEAISKRRETGSDVDDYLNSLLKISTEVELSDYNIFCVLMSLMFAGQATSGTLCTWVVKYLHDNPEVLQRVRDEQDSIHQKMVEDELLTWFKPRSSMPYTLKVINEVLRIESLAAVVPRQAIKDVDYNGIVFSKGTKVLANLSATQLNPNYHSNPLKFNPSRFEEEPKRNTFMPFGQGPHLCPGNDLAITEALFMIHHLVTRYSWERFGSPAPESKLIKAVFMIPGGGYPIVVKRRVPSNAE